MARPDPGSLPVLTVDFDGVICSPPFGLNLGISRTLLDPEAPGRPAFVPPRWLGEWWDRLRYDFRRPLPEAREALARLSLRRRVVVLTGRRSSPTRWLQRHGMAHFVDEVLINQSADRSPHYKLRLVHELGAAEHVEDDGRTAQLLAQRSPLRVYLRDWPRNRDLLLAPGVTRVADLLEVARLIEAEEQRGGATA